MRYKKIKRIFLMIDMIILPFNFSRIRSWLVKFIKQLALIVELLDNCSYSLKNSSEGIL